MHLNIFSFAKFYRCKSISSVINDPVPLEHFFSLGTTGIWLRYRVTWPSAHAHPTCWND